jgi:hypothetical protein
MEKFRKLFITLGIITVVLTAANLVWDSITIHAILSTDISESWLYSITENDSHKRLMSCIINVLYGISVWVILLIAIWKKTDINQQNAAKKIVGTVGIGLYGLSRLCFCVLYAVYTLAPALSIGSYLSIPSIPTYIAEVIIAVLLFWMVFADKGKMLKILWGILGIVTLLNIMTAIVGSFYIQFLLSSENYTTIPIANTITHIELSMNSVATGALIAIICFATSKKLELDTPSL